MGSYPVRLGCPVLFHNGALISLSDASSRRPFLASRHRSNALVHVQHDGCASVDHQVCIPPDVIQINTLALSL